MRRSARSAARRRGWDTRTMTCRGARTGAVVLQMRAQQAACWGDGDWPKWQTWPAAVFALALPTWWATATRSRPPISGQSVTAAERPQCSQGLRNDAGALGRGGDLVGTYVAPVRRWRSRMPGRPRHLCTTGERCRRSGTEHGFSLEAPCRRSEVPPQAGPKASASQRRAIRRCSCATQPLE